MGICRELLFNLQMPRITNRKDVCLVLSQQIIKGFELEYDKNCWYDEYSNKDRFSVHAASVTPKFTFRQAQSIAKKRAAHLEKLLLNIYPKESFRCSMHLNADNPKYFKVEVYFWKDEKHEK